MSKDTNRKTCSDIIIMFVFKITLLIAFAGLLHPYTSKECYSQNKTSSCQILTEWIKKPNGSPRSQFNPCIIKANAFPSGLLLVCWAGFLIQQRYNFMFSSEVLFKIAVEKDP